MVRNIPGKDEDDIMNVQVQVSRMPPRVDFSFHLQNCPRMKDERSDQNDSFSSYELSLPFSETGLSPVYRGAYDKAARLEDPRSY